MIAPVAALLILASAGLPWRADAPPTHEIDLPRFRIHATDKAMGTARLLAAELEQDRDFIAARMGGDYPGLTEVRVGEGIDEVLRLEVPSEVPPHWAAGLAHPTENLILFDAAALRREGGVGLVRHELSHLALVQAASPELPRWFQEGFAVLSASEWTPESALVMMRAARRPIPLEELERGFPEGYGDAQLAYAESASFLEYLYAHRGTEGMKALIHEVHSGKKFDLAFRLAMGDPEALERDWLSSVRVRYTWIPLLTGSSSVFVVMSLLCIAAYARVRRRRARRISELALEEQALLAAERIRAAEQTPIQSGPAEAVGGPPPLPNKPTLH